MLTYWLIFLLPILTLFFPLHASKSLQYTTWVLLGVLFSLFIGLRHQVGGDWNAYLNYYEFSTVSSFDEIPLIFSDVGYGILNWLSGLIDGKIYLVNFLCGTILIVGLFSFCREQPIPWLALIIAIPYIVNVVTMGYTRQGVALGFAMLALLALKKEQNYRFILWVIFATLFHKTAIILLPFAALVNTKNFLWILFWLILTFLTLYFLFFIDHANTLWTNYVENEMASEGGLIRVLMNVIPASLLLIFRKKLIPKGYEYRLWIWIAIFSLICLPLVFFASTAVDRIALYLLPIQVYVFSRISFLFSSEATRVICIVFIVFYYSLIQWVWLNKATHAYAWLPYQFYPFIE